VSFHKLDTNLTRVLVTMDFQPGGMMEKMASGLRFVKRAVEADLARFKTYCEFEDAKGLEYAQPGELQKDDEEKEEGEKDEGRKKSREQSRSNGGDDGDASQSSANSEGRDKSRQERAERREERRAS
jgi:hypothetical protein